jgi:hypothetical protein
MKKKLTLNRESLRSLTPKQLADAPGAMVNISPQTRSCINSLCGSCINDSCDPARTMYVSMCPCPYP